MRKKIVRFQLLITILFYYAFIPVTTGQSASLSLSQLTTCPGNQVTISLTVENLLNVGAITLNIGYDTTVLQYLGSGNTHPQFPGIMTNASTLPQPQVGIAWSSLTPGSLSNGVLLDLYFIFRKDSCNLTFNPGCEISDINFIPIVFNSISGKVALGPPYIIQNPQNISVTEGESASFEVIASAANVFLWQEWSGSHWSDLTNNSTYQNVNTSQMTINDVSLTLDNYLYRCSLTANGGCQVFSNSAQLLVQSQPTAFLAVPDTLGCFDQDINIPISALGLDSIISFVIDISFDPNVASFIGIGSVNPLIYGVSASVYFVPAPHVIISWSASHGITIPTGDLISLVFHFNTGQTEINILNTSNVTRSDMILYNIVAQNGFIAENPDPIIIISPVDTTVISGTVAYFNTSAAGAINYKWFESQDQGITWALLNDIQPYWGTHTPNFSINPATAQFDQYKYKCLVSGTLCDRITDEATLTVDTTTYTYNQEKSKSQGNRLSVISQRFVGEVFNVILVTQETGIIDIAVFDLQGKIKYKSQYLAYFAGNQTIENIIPGIRSGIYLFVFTLSTDSGTIKVCYKTNCIL